jgi:hypothetical protein
MHELLHFLGLCGEHDHFSIIGTGTDIIQNIDITTVQQYYQNLKLFIKSKTN